MTLTKFFSKIKIILISLLLCLSLVAVFPKQAKAEFMDPLGVRTGVWNAFLSAVAKDAGANLQRFTLNTFSYMIESGVLIVAGCEKDKSNCPKDYQVGAIGTTNSLVAMMYNAPPASGVEYVASTLRDFGLVEKAYAQTGTGFDGLAPLRTLWRSFRNITYMFFVLIFVSMGFATMFRYKINPQTVITIQSALPRIVIALLLVTFSYAIAGFMIDMLYVVISLGALAFAGVGECPYTPAQLQNQFTNGGYLDTVGALFGQLPSLNLGCDTPGGALAGTFAVAGGVGALGGALGSILMAWMGGTAIAVSGGALAVGAILMVLILLLIILWVLIRLFFALLQSYIAIILLVIFAPIQIALGVIPGVGGFGSWLKNLTAHLAVFAGVAFVMMLGFVMVHSVSTLNMWQPPLLLGSIVGAPVTNLIGFIIGLGILFTVHQTPNAIKAAFCVLGLGFNPMEAAGERAPITDISGAATRTRIGEMLAAGPGTGPGRHVPTGVWDALTNAARLRRWMP